MHIDAVAHGTLLMSTAGSNHALLAPEENPARYGKALNRFMALQAPNTYVACMALHEVFLLIHKALLVYHLVSFVFYKAY